MDKTTQEFIRGYLTKADEKLGVAQRLLAQADFEDSISRSYYAAFYAAQALLLSEGLTSKTHSGMISIFGLHFVKTGKVDKKFGRFLSNLLEDRQQSDYNLFSGLDKLDADNAHSEATLFIQEIRRLLQSFI